MTISRHTAGFQADRHDSSIESLGPAGVSATNLGGELTVIQPEIGWRGLNLSELWDSRELLYFFVWRDIKVRYKQTVVGAAWAVLQPVCTMAIFTLIFGRLAKMPSNGVPYPIFVYAGLLPWTFFANAVSQSSQSLINQARLLTKIYFPRLYIPSACIGVGLVDFALSFCVYLVLMIWYAHIPGTTLLLLPLFLLLAAIASLGVGVLLSSVTVVYRDFRIVVPYLVQLGMFLSPVVYPPTLVPEAYRWILNLNPMTGIIGGFRGALLGQPFDWAAIAISAAVSVMLLVAGVLNFRRMERRFADIA